MNKYGLIGKDISYSISPFLHKKISPEINYKLIDINEEKIAFYIDKLKKDEYQGFNITKPYKTIIKSYVDEITQTALKIGSINTLYKKDNKIIGDNTDLYGLEKLLKVNNIKIKNRKVAILGTGGAALTAYELLSKENKVIYVSRNKKGKNIISYEDFSKYNFEYIIQATPIGTYPNVNSSVLKKDLVKDKIVIDLIYNPIQTKIMKDSKKGYNGIDMLIFQAVRAQEIWFDKKVRIKEKDLENLRRELYEHIRRKS